MVAVSDQKFDVFLSYSRGDTANVEAIAEMLIGEGVEPWFDKWNILPGEVWQEAIEAALEICPCCAVFVGATGIAPWQNEEMRIAIDRRVKKRGRRFRLIPVLLPHSNKRKTPELPPFLSRLSWVEFRRLNETSAFQKLLSGIRGRRTSQTERRITRQRWRLVLSVDAIDRPTVDLIIDQVQSLSGDVDIRLRKSESGSIILYLESSMGAYERIEKLFTSGQLSTVAGIPIKAVNWVKSLLPGQPNIYSPYNVYMQMDSEQWADAMCFEPSSTTATYREAIARLAYGYWESRGGQGGDPVEDWVQAEREYLERMTGFSVSDIRFFERGLAAMKQKYPQFDSEIDELSELCKGSLSNDWTVQLNWIHNQLNKEAPIQGGGPSQGDKSKAQKRLKRARR